MYMEYNNYNPNPATGNSSIARACCVLVSENDVRRKDGNQVEENTPHTWWVLPFSQAQSEYRGSTTPRVQTIVTGSGELPTGSV